MGKNTTSRWDADYNLSFYVLLVVAVLLSAFLMVQGVQAGTVYTVMFAAFTGLIYVGTLFIKDDANLKIVTDYIRFPVSPNLGVANFFYLIGFGIPIILKLIFNTLLGSSFNIVQLSVPVFGVNINTALQSFSAAEIGGSVAWRIFVTMFAAGTIETFVYNFAAMVMGVLIAVLLIQQRRGQKAKAKKWHVIGIALVFSVLIFVGSHVLNGNYEGLAFLYAGIFLLVSNLSIYRMGVFIMFWVGYHQSNNLLWLIDTIGLTTVLGEGFVSWFGVFFVIYFSLVIWNIVINWDTIREQLAKWQLNNR